MQFGNSVRSPRIRQIDALDVSIPTRGILDSQINCPMLHPKTIMACIAGICPFEKVVCLVVDECHKAKGKTDIVKAIESMTREKVKFRIVGLSATPGRTVEDIQVMLCARR